MSLILPFFYAVLVLAVGRLALWMTLSLSYNVRRKGIDRPSDAMVSIIVPAYNEQTTIAKTIQSLLDLDYGNHEIIVVDDGSTDNTLSESRKFEGRGVKIVHQENRGKAGALNAGIRCSTGTIIVTVDADTTLDRTALRRILDRFARNPRIGAVAGNVKVSPRSGMLNLLQAAEYTTRINLVRKAESVLGCVTVVPGPIAAFRREALEQAAWFSADTFAEDFDMTMTVLRNGYRVEYEDRAIAHTDAPQGLGDLMKQRRRWYRGMIQVLSKHRNMYLRPRFGKAGIFGVPSMWFDVTAPFLNFALILLTLITALFATGSSVPIVGLPAYFALEAIVGLSAITLDPMPKAREYAAVGPAIFYNLFMDGVRMMALAEEMVGILMSWEKPRR